MMTAKTLAKIERVKQLVATGRTTKQACAQAGMNLAFYYQVRSRAKRGPGRPPGTSLVASSGYQVIPIGPARADRSFSIKGSPREVAEFVGYVSAMVLKGGGIQ